MPLLRVIRHLASGRWLLERRFPAQTRAAIAAAIHASETRHGAEIVFAIEPALDPLAVLRDVAPRARAEAAFAELGVWDTEANNGVLVYLLLADHDIEIVADRGFAGRVTDADWEAVCRAMEAEFRAGRFEAGALAGIEALTGLVMPHFPPRGGPPGGELPDQPVVL